MLLSAEAFGLPQLGDAAQAMMPDVQRALQKLNQNLDGLQVTLARANDLLNDRNRANIAGTLNGLERMVAEVRPKANESLDNLNGMLTDTRPKVAASLSNVQELTTRLGPLLDSLNTTTARANDTLGHVDSTLMENRSDIRASVTGLRDTLAKSTALLNQLNQTLDQNSANIDDLLDNLRMTTENLRTLTETLMHSPASLIRGIRVPDRKPGESIRRRRDDAFHDFNLPGDRRRAWRTPGASRRSRFTTTLWDRARRRQRRASRMASFFWWATLRLRKPCRTAGSAIEPGPTRQARMNTIAGRSGPARWSATR